MLEIQVSKEEAFDEETASFVKLKPTTIHLEHSLVSVSKWEEKFHKPFSSSEAKTEEETRYYIQCMVLDPDFDYSLLKFLDEESVNKINTYITDTHSATVINDIRRSNGPRRQPTVTAELVYAWMIMRNIPIEFEHWHFNRLITLIRVIDVEQGKANGTGKMSRAQSASWQREENARRLAQQKTHG